MPTNTPDLATLPERWKSAPRRWGNRLHSMCSYMAMFPPAMPHTFISWLTEPGDVVYDPFSGRGTTALEACLTGRVGVGSDANPLAWLLTASKVDLPSEEEVEGRLSELRASIESADTVGVPPEIQMLFSSVTLRQLVWLRNALDPVQQVDRFLLAVLLGGLHANANSRGEPRGLTVSMPNTFAMAPGYVRRYIDEHGLVPPAVDVLDFVGRRAKRYPIPAAGYVRGRAWLSDASAAQPWPSDLAKAKLVFTSPPYLQVIRYGKFNWIRLWLMSHEPAAVDDRLFTSSSPARYLDFMAGVLTSLESVVRSDGYVVLTIGDVRRKDHHLNLVELVRDRCAAGGRWRVMGEAADHLPVTHKVSRIWKENRGRATKTDRILILGGSDASDLPESERMEWEAIDG